MEAEFKKYQAKAAKVLADNERVQGLLNATGDKLKSILSSSDKLSKFSDTIYLLIRMVKAQFSGEYTEFPWRTVLLIVGALIYFVTPFDLIPDFIPALGLTDDISIVFWVYKSIQEDIEKFETWEKKIEIA